jgi:hypothetical protein
MGRLRNQGWTRQERRLRSTCQMLLRSWSSRYALRAGYWGTLSCNKQLLHSMFGHDIESTWSAVNLAGWLLAPAVVSSVASVAVCQVRNSVAEEVLASEVWPDIAWDCGRVLCHLHTVPYRSNPGPRYSFQTM